VPLELGPHPALPARRRAERRRDRSGRGEPERDRHGHRQVGAATARAGLGRVRPGLRDRKPHPRGAIARRLRPVDGARFPASPRSPTLGGGCALSTRYPERTAKALTRLSPACAGWGTIERPAKPASTPPQSSPVGVFFSTFSTFFSSFLAPSPSAPVSRFFEPRP